MYRPGVSVTIEEAGVPAEYLLHLDEWDRLVDALDRGDTGWARYRSAFGDGELMMQLQTVRSVFRATESHAAERWAYNQAMKLHGDD